MEKETEMITCDVCRKEEQRTNPIETHRTNVVATRIRDGEGSIGMDQKNGRVIAASTAFDLCENCVQEFMPSGQILTAHLIDHLIANRDARIFTSLNVPSVSKHSPGPWMLHEDEIWDTNGHMVAEIYGDLGQERESNANLIAAAPDLLEAVQYALEHMETPGGGAAIDIAEKLRIAAGKAVRADEKSTRAEQ
jgi:hypothetical protein